MIQAQEKDVDSLYAILEECSAWLKRKGIPQWNPVYPKHRFYKDVATGHVFCFTSSNGIISTATLYTTRPWYYPQDFWSEPERVWYLCRFAVRRSEKNKKLGENILKEIETEARRMGIQKIRIDIIRANPFLEQYYSAHGFRKIVDGRIFNTASLFMEKTVNF